MKEIKRYKLVEGFSGWDLHPDEDGDYVEYSDHLEVMALLEARCKELESALEDFREGIGLLNLQSKYHHPPTTTSHLNALIEQKASEMFEQEPTTFKAIGYTRIYEDNPVNKDDKVWQPLYAKKVSE